MQIYPERHGLVALSQLFVPQITGIGVADGPGPGVEDGPGDGVKVGVLEIKGVAVGVLEIAGVAVGVGELATVVGVGVGEF